ncbi:MAG: hypothetical protein KA253_06730 [Campylobacteraceae bacterium]|nr:hypothetical protein [Campylobacteraceae bacterium]
MTFIKLANKELQSSIKAISNDALTLLTNRAWDGNIRELRNMIYNAALYAKHNIIQPADLHVKAKKNKNEFSLKDIMDTVIKEQGIANLASTYEQIEKAFYQAALNQCSNMTKLAEYLNISRLTLRKTLQKYNLYTKIKESD